jgi:oxygen-dependent protoporphyrinogen oxidase
MEYIDYIVIGGGLAGLISAWRLKTLYPTAKIIILEKNSYLGGLLAGITYPKNDLYFDMGAQIFQETGIAELDNFILSCISPQDLIHFPIGAGDLAGAIYNGRLQENSHFPDIRNRIDYMELAKSLKEHLDSHSVIPLFDPTESLLSASIKRFGEAYTNKVVIPITENVYQMPASSLSAFALSLMGLTRVIVDDQDIWEKCACNDSYRQVIGCPDQRNLPVQFRHSRRSFYSRNQGTRSFVEGIATRLRNMGIQILTETTIKELNIHKKIVKFSNSNDSTKECKVHGIIIATGIVGAAKLLGISMKQFALKPPLPLSVINLLLQRPLETDMFYFYGLDNDCGFYRITNYRAFSDNNSDYRVTIEVLHEKVTEDLIRKIGNKMRTLNLISELKWNFLGINEIKMSGFPDPELNNTVELRYLCKEMNRMKADNLKVLAIDTKKIIYFRKQILIDAYESI